MKLKLLRVNRVKLLPGLLLTLLGILMPSIISADQFRVQENLILALEQKESLYILIAALRLVCLNALRGLPHYIGAFLIAEAIELEVNGRPLLALRAVMGSAFVPMVYMMVHWIHKIDYDFGIPALVLLVLLILLGKADYNLVNPFKKVLMLSAFIIAVQFLDIIPPLSLLPVGRGALSTDVKLTAEFMDCEQILTGMGLLFFGTFFIMGTMFLLLIRDENNLRFVQKLKKENQKIQAENQMRMLENRVYQEMQHLVHDLKSPLTSARTLVGLLQMSNEQEGRERDLQYLEKIDSSMDRMSGMISEILTQDRCSPHTTADFLNVVLAQISVMPFAGAVHTNNKAPMAVVSVNKIRFCRAIVNLVENAFWAIDPETGRIDISVYQYANEQVIFQVSDNGNGIDEEDLKKIWDSGFSTRESSGLGLSFVKKVVTDMGGEVRAGSRLGFGTRFQIILPCYQQQKGVCCDENSLH